MSPMISIAGVTKRYKSGLVALDPIDREIAKGEIFALLGPNGAGKTTLIGVVCGSVSMTPGKVLSTDTTLSAIIAPRVECRSRAARDRARHLRDRLQGGDFEPRPVRKGPRPRLYRATVARPFAVGQAGRPDRGTLGRDEAACDDREGAQSRARRPVSRRADRWRGRQPASRHVGAGSRLRQRASPSF